MAPELLRGLRAAVATIGPFFLAGTLERPELRWVALGGWLGAIADPGGLPRRRAITLIAFALGGGLLVSGMEAAALVPYLSVLLLSLLAMVTSLARASGAAAASVGTLLLISAAIAGGGHPGEPLRDGVLFAGGASWAMLLSSVVWPVWTHLPVRRALAAAFERAAEHAAAIAITARAPHPEQAPAHQSPWAALVRTYQRPVRAAIEEARAITVAARTQRAGETTIGANLRALLGLVEQVFVGLVALAEEVELTTDPAARAELAAALDVIAHRLRLTAQRLSERALSAGSKGDGGDHGSAGRSIAPEAPIPAERSPLARRLLDVARVGAQMARSLDRATTDAAEDQGAPPPPALRIAMQEIRTALGAMRDALSWGSPFFRHAVRVTAALAIGGAIGTRVSPEHVAWVSVTAIAVLQPYPGATIGRAIERVVGTVLGSAVVIALMTWVNSPLVLTLALVPLSVAATLTRTRSVRLFALFTTPVFVLFATGLHDDGWSAALRIIDTVLGGIVAVGAAVAIFPSWERARLPETLARCAPALAQYAERVLSRTMPDGAPLSSGHTDGLRRTLGALFGEVETSLERMLAEPRRMQRGADDAVQRITYLRRLSGSLTALDLSVGTGAAPPRSDEVMRYVTGALSPTGPTQAPPELAGLDPMLARIVRRAELLAPPDPARRDETPGALPAR